MSYYLEIRAVQRPFPIGVDELDRVMFSSNYTARALATVTQFEEEIIQKLSTASLATLGVDTFIGPGAELPDIDLVTSVIDTGGMFPMITQNHSVIEQLSVQIVVRGKSPSAVRSRILAIWNLLKDLTNEQINSP